MRILSSQGNTAYLGGCLTTPYETIPPYGAGVCKPKISSVSSDIFTVNNEGPLDISFTARYVANS